MKKILFCSLLLFLSYLYASPVAYTNKDNFLSALNSYQSIYFDDLASGTDITNQTIMGITFTSPANLPLVVINASTGVRYPMTPSSGTKVLSPGASNVSMENDDLELIFSTPMKAFGMDVIFDLPDTASYVSASFYDEANNLIHQIGPHIPAPTSGRTFVGLISNTISIKRVLIDDFDPSLPDDHIAYDSLIFSSVPELGNFISLFLGIILFGFATKKSNIL